MSNKQSQQGLGAVAVLIILVVLAGLAAAIVRLGSSAAQASAMDVMAARALQAAQAGTQWGLAQALNATGSWTTCAGASQTLDLSSTLGTRVTVTCNSTLYNEGENPASPGTSNTVRIFTIDAVACNSTACPDNTRALSPGYVERRKVVQASSS